MTELCPELKEHVVTLESGFVFIMHPFIHNMYGGSDFENDLYNKSLEVKREAFNKCIAEGNYGGALGLVERPYRCDYAYKLIIEDEDITGKDAAELMSWLWCDTENMHQNKDKWYELLEAIKDHRDVFMGEDYEAFQAMPDELTIYRGFDEEKGDMYGFCWTVNREQAEWFANRYSAGSPEVIELKVKKSEVFAYIHRNGRDEEEIIYTGEY